MGSAAAQVDPELEGPTLPSQREDEFRPFVRRLPEFKFWCAAWPTMHTALRTLSVHVYNSIVLPHPS